MVEMKNMYLLPEKMSKDCGAYKTADASGITIAHAQLFHIPTRAGKKNFLPGSTTWRQKFPADQRSIFVLNLHVHKHIVF